MYGLLRNNAPTRDPERDPEDPATNPASISENATTILQGLPDALKHFHNILQGFEDLLQEHFSASVWKCLSGVSDPLLHSCTKFVPGYL
jgi:hypothetical protein